MGVRRVRTAAAADGSALRAVGTGGSDLSAWKTGSPRLQQQQYQELGTAWEEGSGTPSNGPQSWGRGGGGKVSVRGAGFGRGGGMRGEGRILQAVPDGDFVGEGQRHGGSLYARTGRPHRLIRWRP